jgi:hypothetical protein
MSEFKNTGNVYYWRNRKQLFFPLGRTRWNWYCENWEPSLSRRTASATASNSSEGWGWNKFWDEPTEIKKPSQGKECMLKASKKTFVCEAIESNLLSEWIQFKDQAKSLWQSDLDLQDQTHHRRLLKLAKNPYQ